MGNIKFSDGMEFDIRSNSFYLTRRSDGWYVVGKGMLCPVSSVKEGREYIREMNTLERVREMAKENSGSD